MHMFLNILQIFARVFSNTRCNVYTNKTLSYKNKIKEFITIKNLQILQVENLILINNIFNHF